MAKRQSKFSLAKRAKLSVNLTAEADKKLIPRVRRDLKRVLTYLPPNALREVVISLVGDETMSDLHAQSHDDPTPTDVLTYELEHDEEGNVTEGQIVICVPEAARRAGEHRMDVGHEVLLYALHGLLHLCGFDDRKKKDFDKMHATEDHILTLAGFGPLFHRPASPRPARPTVRKHARKSTPGSTARRRTR